MNSNKITDFDQLWDSMMKCRKGVSWKPSVKAFLFDDVENIYRMEKRLKNGTWKNGKPKPIRILYPKKRDGLSISFKDRIYQRSINDNVLYPNASRSFIFDNAACQHFKGTSFAVRRSKKLLWNYYCNYGIEGYVLQIDIHGYYPSMDHDLVKNTLGEYLDNKASEMVNSVLDEQYAGEVGYNPGSQMVQIAGVTVLNKLDHTCKEPMHLKYYIRYMDDFLIFHNNYEELVQYKNEITEILNSLGFTINENKTKITPLKKGFLFLGFHYRITTTGKIIMTLNSQSIKHERKKLYRLVNLCKKGELPREKVDECYRAWKAYADMGNSYYLLRHLDEYYESLWRS